MRLIRPVLVAFGLTAVALPAAAQGLCGGVGDNGQWIGGTEEMSDISTAAAHLEQMALVLMGNEYVALFNVSAATDVRVEAEGRGAGDPIIDLRNAAGDIILSDDDSGGNGASRGEMFLDPGSYCLSMRSYDGTPMTGFVRVGLLSHEALTDGMGDVPLEPDLPDVEPYYGGSCDLAAATPLSTGPVDDMLASGVTFTGTASDAPYLSFQITGEHMITVTAENETADPVIGIYDEYGNWLGENDDFNGLNSQIDITYPLYTGTYCITLSALSDTSAPITVTVKAYDQAAGLIAMYERGEAAPPLDGSYPITDLGSLDARIRQDIQTNDITTWFKVDIKEGGLLVTEAVTNGMGDPSLVLFDDFGRQVAWNDDANNTLDSMIAARVLPGTYLIGVRQFGGGQQVLTRMLFERYVPAQ
jgi:hypothetical protein